MAISVKRVYERPLPEDGYRVLVDRLWPRGVSQVMGHVDLWLRDIAPTTGLRRWYGHEFDRWPEFQQRYRQELVGHGALLDLVLDIEQHRKRVTLLFGARDEERNEAHVVADVLRDRPPHSHR
ncbi:MAG TPA: DUF488 family protein [Candidatus Limnocylindrales bacterium]